MKATELLSFRKWHAQPGHTILSAVLALFACLSLSSCYNSVFDESTVYQSGAREPIEIQSEQVSISGEVLNCAVENGLFEAPVDNGSRTIARLTEMGRALGFSDDVSIGDSGYLLPYTQIRGKFEIEFRQVTKIADVQKGIKRVEGRAGVKINHPCFQQPLALMGIRNGTLTENFPAAFEFDQYGNDWRIANVMH
ncbi:MAG: hypothetical protein ABL995_04200 [Bryobacteraceae bacterium]